MITIIIYSLVVLFFSAGIFKYPSISLAAIFLMFGFEQWAQSSNAFFVLHNTLTNYIVGALVVVSILVKIVKQESVFKNYPAVGWLVILLFVYAFLSIAWVSTPDISYGLWRLNFPYLVIILFLSPFLFSEVEDISKALNAMVVVGTLLILLLLFNSNWTYRGVELIGAGGRKLMGNPLAVAEMGGYVMLAAAFKGGRGPLGLWRWLKWCIMAVGMALAVKSGSRGQFLGMVIAFFAFYPFAGYKQSFGSYLMLVTGFFVFGGLGFWVFEMFAATGGARWEATLVEHDVVGRWSGAIKLLQEWYASPGTMLFGLGNSASYDPKILGIYPHIVPLEILGEEGLIGFALFCLIIVLTLRNIIDTVFRLNIDQQQKCVVMAISAISFFLFILCFKQGNMLGSLPFFATTIYLGKLRNILKEGNAPVGGGA